MQGPISRFAASMAEARAERRDSVGTQFREMDDLEGRSIESLLRLRGWRTIRLAASLIAVPTGWLLAPRLTGLLPVLALGLCMAGILNSFLTVYLLVHVQKAVSAARYEQSFDRP